MQTPRLFVFSLLTAILCVNSVFAQGLYQKVLGLPGSEMALSICRSFDGGYVIAGQVSNGSAGAQDVSVTQVTASGVQVWTKTYGGPGLDAVSQIISTPDSSYLLIGYTASILTGWDLWVFKIGIGGDLLWSKKYGGYGDDLGFGIQPHPDGGYLVVGSGVSYGEGGWDGWIMRISDDGGVIWFRTYGSFSTEQMYGAVPTIDGGFVVTGQTYYYGAGMHDVTLTKIRKDGSFVWMRTYGTSSDDGGSVVMATEDGGFLLSSNTHAGSDGLLDALFIRTDSVGTLVSSSVLGENGDDILPRGDQLDPTHMALGGWMSGPDGSNDAWFVILNDDGNVERSVRYGGLGSDRSYGVLHDPAGAMVLAGFSSTVPAQGNDILLIRADMNGATPKGSVPGLSVQKPITLATSQPIPGQHTYDLQAENGPDSVASISFVSGDLIEFPTPSVYIPKVFGRSSDTISIPVRLRYPAGVAGGDFSVRVDTSVLVPFGVRKGLLAQQFSLAYNVSRPDSVLVSLAGAHGINSVMEGTLFFVDCSVRPLLGDSVTTPLLIAAAQLFDQHSLSLTCVTEPGIFSTSIGRKGDLNEDSVVNAGDAVACLRIAAGIDEGSDRQRWVADLDNDGGVTSFDAVQILRASVGLEPIEASGPSTMVVRVTMPLPSSLSGTSWNVPILISGVPGLVSGILEMRINQSILKMESTSFGPQFTGVMAASATEMDQWRMAFASTTAWDQQEGVLAEIKMKGVTTASTYLPSLIRAEFYDEAGKKFDIVQFSTTTKVSDDAIRPKVLRLDQNYPNPFNPSTTISFHIAEQSEVRLIVYDLLGRQVRTLVSSLLAAGPHSATFDASDLPSGIYFSVLSSGGKQLRRSMLLVK